MDIALNEGIFYETENFTVGTWSQPEVCRTDGGHIVICPKEPVVFQWEFDPEQAKELLRLSHIVGEAMITALNKRGIPVERLNIHDDGNWALGTKKGPKFHLHFYGRAKNSVHQKHGESLYFPDKKTGFWKELEPLNQEDIQEIVSEIDRISKEEKYSPKNW